MLLGHAALIEELSAVGNSYLFLLGFNIKSKSMDIEIRLVESGCLFHNENYVNDEKFSKAQPLLEALTCGNFPAVLQTEFGNPVFDIDFNADTDDLQSKINIGINRFMEDDSISDKEKELIVLLHAVANLALFTQYNISGHCPKDDPQDALLKSFQEIVKKLPGDYFYKKLNLDGEMPYTLGKCLSNLYVAKCILLDCQHIFKNCKTNKWWLMRCLKLHQYLLDERSPTLKNTIMNLIESIPIDLPIIQEERNRSASVQFYCEAASLSLFYYEYKKSKELIKQAEIKAGLDINLTGMMGKKTKFQKTSHTQCVLLPQRKEKSEPFPHTSLDRPQQLPKDVTLDHEVLLDKIKFDEEVPETAILGDYEGALLLAMAVEHKKSQAMSPLVDTEVDAFLECILSQPRNWCVQQHALLMRCQKEKGVVKKLERLLAQMEEISNGFKKEGPNPWERMHLVFASDLPASWKIERYFAHVLLYIGTINSALEVFQRLELWKDTIECLQMVGRIGEAEKLIREQLAIEETPQMLCYLGDVTKDCSFYEKSWEMSNSHYSRAQKMWGITLFNKGKFQESIDHLEKCLELNPLQAGLWFSYGCACMAAGELEKGVHGFRMSVNQEYDNFQGWNNLAACLIRLNQKKKAFTILKEAIKCSYNNGRLWENLLMTGVDIGEFEEAINAYHQVIECNSKHSDPGALEILVKAVKEDIKDIKDVPSSKYRQKLQELFGRITSGITNEAKIWRLYAQLVDDGNDGSVENNEKVITYMQKAQRCATQGNDWLEDIEKCKAAITESISLAHAYIDLSKRLQNQTRSVQMLSSAKLMLNGIKQKVLKRHTGVTGELNPELTESCNDLESNYTNVLSQLDLSKGT